MDLVEESWAILATQTCGHGFTMVPFASSSFSTHT